jgi:hypothetical protein
MSKKTFEHGQDFVFDKIASFAQRANYWSSPDRLWHSIIENWLQGEYGIHLHFGTNLAIAHLKAGNYCARFERPPEFFFSKQSRLASDNQIQSRIRKGGRRRQEGAVLVPLVNNVNLPKQLGLRPFPAMIWLQPLDQCSHPAGNSRHPLGGVGKVLPGFHKWKKDIALFAWRWPSKQKHQMVQCGSQVVGGIANEEIHQRRHRIDITELGNEPALAVLLKNESIEARAQETVGRILNRLDVFMGPPELPPQILQFIRHKLGERT